MKFVYEKLERINFPDDEWVVMDVSPKTAGDIMSVDEGMKMGEVPVAMLARRIREWSARTPDGEMVPITTENIARLSMEDFELLVSKIPDKPATLSDEEKKTTSSTSQTDGIKSIPVL